MKKVFYILSAVILVGLNACDQAVDRNIDPLAASEENVNANLLAPVAMVNLASNRSIEILPSFGVFSQHWASGGSAGVFSGPEVYAIGLFGPNNTWNNYYTSQLVNYVQGLNIALAADPVQVNVAAQSRFLIAFSFYQLTVMFGDIPFSEAIQPDIAEPAFESQATVLQGIVDMIDQGLSELDDSDPTRIDDGDLIYGGDLARWEMFANSLKLKALVLLQNGGIDVSAQLANVVQQPLITSVADEANFPFSNNVDNEHSYWKLLDNFSNQESTWHHYSDAMESLMDPLQDPRIATFFDEGEDDPAGQFDAIGPGEGGAFTDDFAVVSLNLARPDFPDRWMTSAEIVLLQAELAALGIIPGGMAEANSLLQQGVSLSMQFFDGQPGAIAAGEQTAFLGRIPNLTTLSQQEALETIWGQQYIDRFFRGIEGWTQWRRTGFPELDLPQGAVLGNIIQRFPYSTNEIAANPNHPPQPQLDLPMFFTGN